MLVAIVGECLNAWLMPINKNLWTPSFVVFTAGLGMLGLGTIFWLADVRGRRRWALPFTIYGTNAIAAYVAAGLAIRIATLIKVSEGAEQVSLSTFINHRAVQTMHNGSAWMQVHHLFAIDTPGNTALVYPIVLILFVLLLMSVLYVSRIFIKV